MIERKHVLFCTLVIAIVALFAAKEAIAQVSCRGDFTITYDSQRPGLYGGIIFRYLVTSGSIDVSKISLLEFAIDGSFMVQETGYPQVSWHVPGEGGQNGWCADVPAVGVVSITPQPNQGIAPVEFEVLGATGSNGSVGVWTKSGKTIDTCMVDGPVPGLSPYTSCPPHKIVNLVGVDYCIDLDPQTCCPDRTDPVVHRCDDSSVLLSKDDSFKLGQEGSEEAANIFQGLNDDPRCPMGKVGHNPCQWVYLGKDPFGPVCW